MSLVRGLASSAHQATGGVFDGGGVDAEMGVQVVCSLFAILDNNRHYHQYALPEAHPNLRDWFARFGSRPSAVNIR